MAKSATRGATDGSVDLAVEEVVLFLAGRSVTADGAADERGYSQSDENGRQITAQL
jgi:hypothetical protein